MVFKGKSGVKGDDFHNSVISFLGLAGVTQALAKNYSIHLYFNFQQKASEFWLFAWWCLQFQRYFRFLFRLLLKRVLKTHFFRRRHQNLLIAFQVKKNLIILQRTLTFLTWFSTLEAMLLFEPSFIVQLIHLILILQFFQPLLSLLFLICFPLSSQFREIVLVMDFVPTTFPDTSFIMLSLQNALNLRIGVLVLLAECLWLLKMTFGSLLFL